MMTFRFRHLTLAAMLAMLLVTSVRAADDRCTSGRWSIDGGAVTIGPLAIAVVGLSDGKPVLDTTCRAVRWALGRVEGETRLRALFVCRAADPTRRHRFLLRLRARITDGCRHMQGAFGLRRLGEVVRFAATLLGGECASNAQCDETAYCAKPVGHCDARGVCEARPLGCPDNVDPVCGCDRVTYSNACDAAAAGVSIAHRGECRAVCGGIAGIPCADDEFCDLPAGQCGSADLEGHCVPVTDACPEFYFPVCGCDGVTYANDCFRQAARAQKAHDGACSGCTEHVDCPPNEFCQSPEGHCGAVPGSCTFIEQVCPGEYDPVCGCDGETYANRCRAAMHGISIAHAGTCDGVCGGIAGIPCPDGEICELPAGQCGWADLQGRCVEKGACIQVYDPVCGCDGKTYPNDCERRQAGVQKAHDGACRCVSVCCAPGSRAVDTDRDGCPDGCVAIPCPCDLTGDDCVPTPSCPGSCETACDCYAALGTSFCDECPLLCPNCGSYWQCEEKRCVEQCGQIPFDVVTCFLDPAR